MVAAAGDVADGEIDRRRTRRRGERRLAALERREALFKDVGGRGHQSGVDVAALGQTEAARRLRGVLEDVRSGGVDWARARIGRGIGGLLADVQGEGFKTVIIFRHFCVPFLSDELFSLSVR